MPAPTFRYHAFISYAPEDNRGAGHHWAGWLLHTLETYEVPAGVAGRPSPAGPVPASLFPIYLAPRESAADGPPDAATREALEQSRSLIVICSPRAAASRRVAEEIRVFKQLGRERIFALIIAGDPEAPETRAAEQCFPDTLRHDIRRDGSLDREWRVHPISADARLDSGSEGYTTAAALREALLAGRTPPPRAREDAAAYAEKLDAARLKIVGGVLGAPALELTRLAPGHGVAAGAKKGRGMLWVMLVLILVAGTAGAFWWRASQEKLDAEDALHRSDNLIAWTQRDLSTKLRKTNQLILLEETNELIRQHFQLAAARTGDVSARSALANTLADAADIASVRTNYPKAADLARQGLAVREDLAHSREAPSGTDLLLVGDHRRLAQIFQKGGNPAEALKSAERAHGLAETLAQNRAADPAVLEELARTDFEYGDILSASAKWEDARRVFEEGHAAAQRLAAASPAQAPAQYILAQGEARLGRLLQQRGDFSGALARYRAAETIITPLAAAHPADAQFESDRASVHAALGAALGLLQKFSEAVVEERLAMEISEALARSDRANLDRQFDFAVSLQRLAESLFAAGPENKMEGLVEVQRAMDLLAQYFTDKGEVRANNLRSSLEKLRENAMR